MVAVADRARTEHREVANWGHSHGVGAAATLLLAEDEGQLAVLTRHRPGVVEDYPAEGWDAA